MKWIVIVVCALIIGFGLGWILGRSLKTNDIRLLVEPGGAVNTHPRPGDILSWEGAGPHLKFTHSDPCKGQRLSDSHPSCLMDPSAKAGLYFFTCDTCADPGIPYGESGLGGNGVGSIGGPFQATARGTAPTGTSTSIIDCNQSMMPVADPVVVGNGYAISWFPDPNLTFGTWTVTNVQGPNGSPPICGMAIGSATNQVCSIPANAGLHSGDVYNYTVTIAGGTSCPGNTSMNKITVN
jgi:hypothetical protein